MQTSLRYNAHNSLYGFNSLKEFYSRLIDKTRDITSGLYGSVSNICKGFLLSYEVRLKVNKIIDVIEAEYAQCNNYERLRNFYDTITISLQLLNRLNYRRKVFILDGFMLDPVFKRMLDIHKEYQSLAYKRLLEIDTPIFKSDGLFQRILEKDSWEDRCKQYSILV